LKIRQAERVDVCVVGAGVVGLAASLGAIDRGAKVVCFEAGRPGAGQSAGETRLFRHRHDDGSLVRLAIEARAAWENWEARWGLELVGGEGVLRFGDDVQVAYERLRHAGGEVVLLDVDEQFAVLPALRSPAPTALFEPRGGAIRARRAITSLVDAIDSALVFARVFSIKHEGERVLVRTSEGIWLCDRVIVCAGTATAALVAPLGLDASTRLGCHPRVTFSIRDALRGETMACLQDGSATYGEMVYGSPVPGRARYAVGLVTADADAPCHQASGTISSDAVHSLVERICSYVEAAMPGLEPTPTAVRLCHTTKLNKSKDAFGVWSDGRVLAVGGNNMFKFAPVLGSRLARAALEDRAISDIAAAVGE